MNEICIHSYFKLNYHLLPNELRKKAHISSSFFAILCIKKLKGEMIQNLCDENSWKEVAFLF